MADQAQPDIQHDSHRNPQRHRIEVVEPQQGRRQPQGGILLRTIVRRSTRALCIAIILGAIVALIGFDQTVADSGHGSTLEERITNDWWQADKSINTCLTGALHDQPGPQTIQWVIRATTDPSYTDSSGAPLATSDIAQSEKLQQALSKQPMLTTQARVAAPSAIEICSDQFATLDAVKLEAQHFARWMADRNMLHFARSRYKPDDQLIGTAYQADGTFRTVVGRDAVSYLTHTIILQYPYGKNEAIREQQLGL